jgi:hypothetical protein
MIGALTFKSPFWDDLNVNAPIIWRFLLYNLRNISILKRKTNTRRHYIIDDIFWNKVTIIDWLNGSKDSHVIVDGNRKEQQQTSQFNDVRGLSFDRQGYLYVVDL